MGGQHVGRCTLPPDVCAATARNSGHAADERLPCLCQRPHRAIQHALLAGNSARAPRSLYVVGISLQSVVGGCCPVGRGPGATNLTIWGASAHRFSSRLCNSCCAAGANHRWAPSASNPTPNRLTPLTTLGAKSAPPRARFHRIAVALPSPDRP
jgi:hypothetical protein